VNEFAIPFLSGLRDVLPWENGRVAVPSTANRRHCSSCPKDTSGNERYTDKYVYFITFLLFCIHAAFSLSSLHCRYSKIALHKWRSSRILQRDTVNKGQRSQMHFLKIIYAAAALPIIKLCHGKEQLRLVVSNVNLLFNQIGPFTLAKSWPDCDLAFALINPFPLEVCQLRLPVQGGQRLRYTFRDGKSETRVQQAISYHIDLSIQVHGR